LATSISAPAQRQGGFGGGGAFGRSPCLVPGTRRSWQADNSAPRNIDRSGFVYARLRYTPQPNWHGDIPWHHDYPDGDTMLPDSLNRLTTLHTSPDSYQIVDIDSKELFKYPFVYMSEVGYLDLQPADVKNLREYLDRGGFILVDDFRGNEFDNSEMENFVVQLKKLYPDRNLEPIPPSHQIFHSFFDIDSTQLEAPYMMPNSGKVQFLGLSDDKGRLQIMVDFNYDASEYWQALDIGQCSIHESGSAVQLGINYVFYAITH
jgi:hypothetical protein